ncbi:TetR/AcrR family transcriptional regulator [Polymorphospora sp. NPDC050346]|uniref:TetR/AcrR family transcriptional regulator n=1 Tax=Polymorphospora sp. NPDC050346 TaxID=3155780 RepID=UPI0033C34F33
MTSPGTAPTGRRDRKKRETRDALINAALRLAAERGVEQVTVEEISDAADVSSRTFFNYFSSKDEAITGRDRLAGQRLRDRVQDAPAHLSPLEALRLAVHEELARLEDDKEGWRLRMSVIGSSPQLLARLTSLGQVEERELTNAIAEKLGADVGRSAYPHLVAAAVGTAVRVALARWCAEGESRPLPALVDEAFDLLAAGLAAPATDPAGPTGHPTPRTPV